MAERKQEIINTCLETFIEHGLIDISMRDLGEKLGMDATSIYYYFKGRDELVVACAEEATVRIENELFGTAYRHIENPQELAKALDEKAVSMRPLMQFFISVCTSKKYCDKLRDLRYRQGDRYRFQINRLADKLGCEYDKIAPLVYITTNTMFSYMVFDPDNFSAPQLRMVRDALTGLLEARNNKE